MWAYIVRRLFWLVVVLLVITFVTFVIFFLIPPVDPAVLFAGKSPSPAVIAAITKEFGLDKPILVQYGLFVKHLILGDQFGWPGLGFSFVYRSSVKSLMEGRLMISIELALGAAIIWVTLGMSIGIVSALHRGKAADRIGMGLALFFVSAPAFWLGLMFLWIFWYKLGIASGTGYVPITQDPASWLNHMIMPWVVLALLYAAWYARMTRASMLGVLHEDYVRTARAKGVSERRVVVKHVLRPSLVPLVTMFGMDLGALIGGAIIIEQVFNLQGMGQWAIQSIFTGDLPAIIAITLVAAFAIVFANLVVDVLYAFLDPRVRYT
jgi:peptide/nickel transport system permease protein